MRGDRKEDIDGHLLLGWFRSGVEWSQRQTKRFYPGLQFSYIVPLPSMLQVRTEFNLTLYRVRYHDSAHFTDEQNQAKATKSSQSIQTPKSMLPIIWGRKLS